MPEVQMSNGALEKIWKLLENEISSGDHKGERVYRRLGLENEDGIRLGVISPGNIRELLVQIEKKDGYSFSSPKWVGMGFETITLNIPHRNTGHIRIFLESREHEDVFTSVCSDISDTLSGLIDPELRTKTLQNCLDRWDHFFKKCGPDGLTQEAQRGLFGELTWLDILLDHGQAFSSAVESWVGCRQAYHDFEMDSRVVEVKTTMKKEPISVRINNERQLDDKGLESLHLFILTLHKLEKGGKTLPELVEDVRVKVKGDMNSKSKFEKSLKDSGYLDIHSHIYTSGYIEKNKETFTVGEGFPRIVKIPDGTGNLSYSLTISACSGFKIDLDEAIRKFIGAD